MLEAKIHKEITEFEGKIFFGMTGKQIICVLIAFAIVIPLFFFLYGSLGVEITGYICIVVAAPIMAVGFFKYRGRTFTELLKIIIKFYFKNSKLKYISVCDLDYLEKDVTIKNGKRSRNNRKIVPGYECDGDTFRSPRKRKEIRKKREEIRQYIAAHQKQYVLQ